MRTTCKNCKFLRVNWRYCECVRNKMEIILPELDCCEDWEAKEARE